MTDANFWIDLGWGVVGVFATGTMLRMIVMAIDWWLI